MARGWFAEYDEGATVPSHPWQPCLQLDGHQASLDIWFASEAACEYFIKREVLGRGMWEDDGRGVG